MAGDDGAGRQRSLRTFQQRSDRSLAAGWMDGWTDDRVYCTVALLPPPCSPVPTLPLSAAITLYGIIFWWFLRAYLIIMSGGGGGGGGRGEKGKKRRSAALKRRGQQRNGEKRGFGQRCPYSVAQTASSPPAPAHLSAFSSGAAPPAPQPPTYLRAKLS